MAKIVLFNGVKALSDAPTAHVVTMLPLTAIRDILSSMESEYSQLAEARGIMPGALLINPFEVVGDLRAALGIEEGTL